MTVSTNSGRDDAGDDAGRAHVIVADDDPVTSHLICAILRRGGYEPRPVPDVQSLFAACVDGPRPVAIVLDMHMPGGTGAASLDRLRDVASGIPVIVVSGEGGDAVRADSTARGAFAYLTKPVDFPALLEVLGRATGASA